MLENTITAPSGTLMEYLPSMSVMAPLRVPFSNTLAPIIGEFCLSVTVPVTFTMFCANRTLQKKHRLISDKMILLIVGCFIIRFIGYSFYLNFQFTYIIWYGIPSNADAKLATIKIKRFALCVYKLFFHTFRHVNPFKNLAICS